VALEHPPEGWVPFAFGETEHACVRGADRSDGRACVRLFPIVRKPNCFTLFLAVMHSLSSGPTEVAQRCVSERKPTPVRLLQIRQGQHIHFLLICGP